MPITAPRAFAPRQIRPPMSAGANWAIAAKEISPIAARRVLLVDSNFRVIAASDGQGLLTERISLQLEGRRSGFYQDRSGGLTAFHATPGYETYKGLGWYGVIQGGAT